MLRYIYGCKIEDCDQKSWQYWLNLVETADKYLEPVLSSEATVAFKTTAFSMKETDIEVICEVLQTLQDTDRYELFKGFAVDLTMRHLDLLDNKQFRAQVYSGKRVMFKLVERLSSAADLVPVKVICAKHGEMELYGKNDSVQCRVMRCLV